MNMNFFMKFYLTIFCIPGMILCNLWCGGFWCGISTTPYLISLSKILENDLGTIIQKTEREREVEGNGLSSHRATDLSVPSLSALITISSALHVASVITRHPLLFYYANTLSR